MKKIFTPAKKKSILMVDDDQFATDIYQEKLEAQGFKVEVTRDFDSTLQALKKAVADLVILDLCLPGINVVELIKNIRSEPAMKSVPIIAFSNPYLSNLTRAAVEAGATKFVAKVDNTPEQIIDLMRELGVSATSRVSVSGAIEELETNQEKLASKLLINRSEILAKLRASYQNFTRTEREDLRRTALLQIHRQLRLLAGGASALAFQKIAQMSTALEALLIELYTDPVKVTPSVVRTVAHSIETMASLVDRAANSQDQAITPQKILAVDDEIISREMVCSALGRAGLHAKSLDDPLAAQRLLEKEHFDLIFLDVEMPGQTGLEHMGHEVVVTRSGTEAWETFDRAPVRVVVSDWMMPGMDGLEFCHRVRGRPDTPYIYFILLTALDTDAENYDLATKAGIDDFLTKPLDAIAIQMRLRVADRILWFTREVHQLKQLIPICAYCHKIHTATDYWERFETYIKQQTGAEFSHGICPECLEAERAKLKCASYFGSHS